mmetsp:Transcript_36310/g.104327  ORF Transcript_36310/g.104327 Transcript_36310/m.104327 type:complete len:294 (+) Transcript_36310:140-1021(+)
MLHHQPWSGVRNSLKPWRPGQFECTTDQSGVRLGELAGPSPTSSEAPGAPAPGRSSSCAGGNAVAGAMLLRCLRACIFCLRCSSWLLLMTIFGLFAASAAEVPPRPDGVVGAFAGGDKEKGSSAAAGTETPAAAAPLPAAPAPAVTAAEPRAPPTAAPAASAGRVPGVEAPPAVTSAWAWDGGVGRATGLPKTVSGVVAMAPCTELLGVPTSSPALPPGVPSSAAEEFDRRSRCDEEVAGSGWILSGRLLQTAGDCSSTSAASKVITNDFSSNSNPLYMSWGCNLSFNEKTIE